jgi:nicotinic acid phosphoribosyltransferase
VEKNGSVIKSQPTKERKDYARIVTKRNNEFRIADFGLRIAEYIDLQWIIYSACHSVGTEFRNPHSEIGSVFLNSEGMSKTMLLTR